MNQLELLSPAGDLEIFKSVVNAGADAVYFGGDLFGARAYAKNFTIDEAKEAIKYAHFHNAKAYLTVNTLLKNLEIEKELYSYLRAYVENGIDAFIVQDFGVCQFIKDYFPDVEIHASTQMSLCTKHGAKLLEDFGASRIVTAREISLEEISMIHKACPELEIESFIHGALCVCYSGQCFMSSLIGGRSGNRGRCAQPCRLPYKVEDMDHRRVKTRGDYVLSPKDFCTIENLPKMIDAGVMSFKIEGRMKQISYATGVVSVYRKYLDEYLYKGARNYSVNDEDIQKLLDYGNRSGFTDLYLTKHNGKELITFDEPSHTKNNNEVIVAPEKKTKLNCKVVARLGQEFEVRLFDDIGHEVISKGNIIEESKNKPATREDIIKGVSALGNTDFVIDKMNIEYDDNIFLPVSVIKNARRDAIEKFYSLILNNENKQINEYTELQAFKNKSNTSPAKVFVNALEVSQALEASRYDFVDSICVPVEKFYDVFYKINNKNIYVSLPTIIRDNYLDDLVIPIEASGVLVSSMDGIGLLNSINYPKNKVILDYRIYRFSNRAQDAFFRSGYLNNCIPIELSLKEISHCNNENSQLIIYSRFPLMVTANCTNKNTKGCNRNNDLMFLVDRKNASLPVKCNCTYCYNTIYNSIKYNAFSLSAELAQLGAKEYRIDFSIEDEKEVNEILESYNSTFIEGNRFVSSEEYTKGHLKRGVE